MFEVLGRTRSFDFVRRSSELVRLVYPRYIFTILVAEVATEIDLLFLAIQRLFSDL